MKCDDYIQFLKSDYDIIKALSNKKESKVLLLKHKVLKKYLVLRQYSISVIAYDYINLKSYKGLPLVYDSLHFDDGQIVLEEYIDGITVADVLENGIYTYNGAKKIIQELCLTLSFLHKACYIHRDIKPENIMISKNGVVKLIDFNASRKYDFSQNTDTVQIGTIGYASPEQFGIAQTDTRTDIYAIGVLLNIMLTGKHPSKQIATGKAKKIILKCTQINPNERYQTVEELFKDL